MATVTSHPPGTFCWPELATTDQKSAVTFYRALFAWDVNEQPVGPGETYSMFQLQGKPVAAAHTLQAEQRAHDVPPHWGSYISVANADERAKRARQLGATILAEPFDVMDVGRMAVVQDPVGAVFMLWQGRRHPGAMILGETGTLCWTELITRDPKAAESFYKQLFGWSSKLGTDGGTEYWELSNSGRPQGGLMALRPEMGNMPPAWTPYFAVADCDASAKKASQFGGRMYVPPTDIPKVGRFAVLADPQGAMFDIVQLVRA
jgi:predicted enzyme related to lactoylglutathione lyase